VSGAPAHWRIGLPVAAALLAGLGAGSAVWRELQDQVLLEERRVVDGLERQVELARRQASVPAGALQQLQIAAQPDVTGSLQALATIGAETGVQLGEARPLPAATPGRQSFRLAGRGTPAAVCGFLAGIEGAGRLFVLESGSIEPAAGDELAFDLAIATFHGRAGGG
jgi:hypothetical protein